MQCRYALRMGHYWLGENMAEMTEEEADALDELWTKTTPKINVGAGGRFLF
ncbi:hypothetical protein FACS1894190_00020 [Spirochaetia bacterium]|nr:hypothetical protein FACS1894190_00020 [Spirochaetia bacterium]